MPWDSGAAGTGITLSNGDMTATMASGTWRHVRTVLGRSSGKWYAEMVFSDLDHGMAGIANSSANLGDYAGDDSYGHSFYNYSGGYYTGGSSSSYGSTFADGDVIGLAVDLDNGKVWCSKNGTWQNSGDPVAGTNPMASGLSGTLYLAGSLYSAAVTLNEGASAFTYTPPTGFSGWRVASVEANDVECSSEEDTPDLVATAVDVNSTECSTESDAPTLFEWGVDSVEAESEGGEPTPFEWGVDAVEGGSGFSEPVHIVSEWTTLAPEAHNLGSEVDQGTLQGGVNVLVEPRDLECESSSDTFYLDYFDTYPSSFSMEKSLDLFVPEGNLYGGAGVGGEFGLVFDGEVESWQGDTGSFAGELSLFVPEGKVWGGAVAGGEVGLVFAGSVECKEGLLGVVRGAWPLVAVGELETALADAVAVDGSLGLVLDGSMQCGGRLDGDVTLIFNGRVVSSQSVSGRLGGALGMVLVGDVELEHLLEEADIEGEWELFVAGRMGADNDSLDVFDDVLQYVRDGGWRVAE